MLSYCSCLQFYLIRLILKILGSIILEQLFLFANDSHTSFFYLLQVNTRNEWASLCEQFHLPGGCINSGVGLKQIYLR